MNRDIPRSRGNISPRCADVDGVEFRGIHLRYVAPVHEELAIRLQVVATGGCVQLVKPAGGNRNREEGGAVVLVFVIQGEETYGPLPATGLAKALAET